MADLLAASLKTFEINQLEYEWSALAYTLLRAISALRTIYGPETIVRSAGGSVDPRAATGCVPKSRPTPS